MTASTDDSSRKDGSSPRLSLAFSVLTIVFLLTVTSLISFLILPQLLFPVDKTLISVEEDSAPLTPYVPIVPIDNVIYPNDKEGKETPRQWKVGDVKRPMQRQDHPEDADVDDLPFSRGMNPRRERRHEFLYRLASFIQPLHYEVMINVNVRGWNGANASTLSGTSSIYFRVNGDASNLLELHTEGFSTLELLSLNPTDGMGVPLPNSGVKPIWQNYNEVKRTTVWLLNRPMINGEMFVMLVHWTTEARSWSFYGLYETWDNLPNGGRVYQLATQGEIMGTRTWMPAFDEPALKATLSLTIIHPSQLNARSNAPIQSTAAFEGMNVTVFAKTARISPYLYAWSLTNYPEISTNVNGVKVSVIANRRPERLNSSLQHAKFAVQAYFSVLSINHSLVSEKIDFVFVPDHISAMENVGHITAGINTINWGYMYVHEMMHQYFGNLITLLWWDEVWINEGLTTVYEIDAVHGIGTEAAIADLRGRRDSNIEHDSLRKTIALKNEVTTEMEASGNFEKSYSKGSVVLYMLRNLIGETAWKDGVQTFLNKFALRAVKGDDFLRTIKEISEKYHIDDTPEFAYFMAKDFFELRGFPLLKIKRNGRKIELRQVRFLRGFFDGLNKENIPLSTHFWRIPVHLVRLDGTPYKTILMDSREMKVELDTNEELIIDPKKIVYYRVIYDENTYKELAKVTTKWDDLEPILTDLIHSAFSGYVDIDLAFDVVYRHFKAKDSYEMKVVIYGLLFAMFHFDTARHIRIYGLINRGSTTAYDSLYDRRKDDPIPYLCDNIRSYEDAFKEYSNNRQNLNLLFCPEVKKSMGEELYGDILESFLGDQQLFNPKDITVYLQLLKIHYPNMTADLMVKISLAKAYPEHELASLLHEVQSGFDLGHTEQLRRIFENAPQAARENREFITRIFNERHAAISEAKELGDKIESALKKHLTSNSKSAKSRGFLSRKKAKHPDLGSAKTPYQKMQYY